MCPHRGTAWDIRAGLGTDSSVILNASSTSNSGSRTLLTAAPSQPYPTLHLALLNHQDTDQGSAQYGKAQGHFLPFFDKSCYSTIMWASMKSRSNKDTEGWFSHRKRSSLHSLWEGSVNLHRAVRTGAGLLIFASFVVYVTQELYSTFCSNPALTWCDAPALAVPALAQSIWKLQVSFAPHWTMKTYYRYLCLPLPHLHSLRLLLKHSSLPAFDNAHARGGPACCLAWGYDFSLFWDCSFPTAAQLWLRRLTGGNSSAFQCVPFIL